MPFLRSNLDELPPCPYLHKRPAGDDSFYWCELSDHSCTNEYSNRLAIDCEDYIEFLFDQGITITDESSHD
jgi:hypothetical protein